MPNRSAYPGGAVPSKSTSTACANCSMRWATGCVKG